MDVKLPDGRVIQNVPEDITQEDLLERVTLYDQQQTQPQAEQPQEKTTPLSLASSVKRGFRDSLSALDLSQEALGLGGEENIKEIAQNTLKAYTQNPPTKESSRFREEILGEDVTATEAIGIALSNPLQTLDVFAESLGSMTLPAAAAATTAGAFKVVPQLKGISKAKQALTASGVFGAGSGFQEGSFEILDSLSAEGVDMTNEEAIKEAFEDEELMNRVKRRAVNRGVAIGTFDALSGVFAGKLLNKMRQGASKKELASRLLGETAIASGLGASGEASAQLLNEGEIKYAGAVALEGLMEGFTGIPTAAIKTAVYNPNKLRETSDIITGQTKGPREEVNIEADLSKKETPTQPADTRTFTEKLGDSVSPENYVTEETQQSLDEIRNEINIPVEDEITAPEVDTSVDPLFQTDTPKTGVTYEAPTLQEVPTQTTPIQEAAPIQEDALDWLPDVDLPPVQTQRSKEAYTAEVAKTQQLQKDFDRQSAKINTFEEEGVIDINGETIEVNSDKGQLQMQIMRDNLYKLEKTLKDQKDLLKTFEYAETSYVPSYPELEPTVPDVTDPYREEVTQPTTDRQPNLERTTNRVVDNSEDVAVQNLETPVTREQRLFQPDTDLLLDVTPTWQQSTSMQGSTLYSLPLTETGRQKHNKIISEMEKTLKKITKGKASLEPTSMLMNDVVNKAGQRKGEMLRGAQLANVVYVALETNNSLNLKQNETLLHEAYHIVRDELQGFFTPRDRKILSKAQPKMRQILEENYGILASDLGNLGENIDSEVEATLFGLMMSDPNSAPVRQTPVQVKGLFNKVKKFFQELKQRLNGENIRTFEDIFAEVNQGDYKTTKDFVETIALEQKKVRTQKIVEDYQKAQDEHINNILTEQPWFNKEKLIKGAQGSSPTKLGHVGQMISTLTGMATRSSVFAQMQSAVRAKYQDKSTLLKDYQKRLKDLMTDGESFIKAAETLEYMRLNNQRLTYTPEGLLRFIDEQGAVRTLDYKTSDAVKKADALFKKILSDNLLVTRQRLNDFEGLSSYMSWEMLERTIANEDFREQFLKKYDPTTLQNLENIISQIKEVETKALFDNRAYIPFTRTGTFGITVTSTTETDPKTKKPKVLYHGAIEENMFGDPDPKQLAETKKEIERLFEGRTDVSVSGVFEMTHDNIKEKLGNNFVSTEMLAALFGSGKESLYVESVKDLQKNLGKTGMMKHFLDTRNIAGYSKEWADVVTNFVEGAAHETIKNKYAPTENLLATTLETTPWANTKVKKRAIDTWRYLMSPEADMQNMRLFNFLWTMGGNFSTAILQFTTVPIHSVAYATAINPNILKNNFQMMRAMKVASRYFLNPDRIMDKSYMDNLVEKKKITPEERKFLELAYKEGYIQMTLAQDQLGEEFVGRRRNIKTKFVEKAAAYLGAPTQVAEHLSRLATGLVVFNSMETDANIKNAKEHVKSSKLWQEYNYRKMISTANDSNIRERLAMFAIDEVHAVFGKEGRGQLQRGIWGSLILPFATYPMHAVETLLHQATQRGKQGKVAAMYALSAYIVFAGLMGIPGFDFADDIYEKYHEIIGGDKRSFNKDLREALIAMGFDPETAMHFVEGGITSKVTSTSMAPRIGLSLHGTDFASALLGGETALQQIGVLGSVLEGVGQSIQEAQQGGSVADVLGPSSPIAIKNMLKGVKMATDGVSTRRGTRIVNEDEVNFRDAMKQALGFRPLIIDERTKMQYFARLEAAEGAGRKSRFVEREARILEEIIKARKDKNYERAKELMKEKHAVRKEAREWVRDNKIKVSRSWWQGYNNSIQRRVQQRRNPESVSNISKKLPRDFAEKFAPVITDREGD